MLQYALADLRPCYQAALVSKGALQFDIKLPMLQLMADIWYRVVLCERPNINV